MFPLTVSGLVRAPKSLYARTMQRKHCKVCLVEHDEEIHAATLSLKQWFREKVTRAFQPEPTAEVTVPAA
jgi:hypothetical protein